MKFLTFIIVSFVMAFIPSAKVIPSKKNQDTQTTNRATRRAIKFRAAVLDW